MNTPSKAPPPIYLLDGGLGTTLADHHGCVFNNSTPLWSAQLLLTDPAKLLKAQTAFAEAGADVIFAATYQASFEGFAKSGVGEYAAAREMRKAVGIARRAFRESNRSGEGRVTLGLGAYGAVMAPSQEYSGKYDESHVTVEQLRDWHRRRVDAFSKGDGEGSIEEVRECWRNVDYVLFETLPLLVEVLAVRETMFDVSKQLDAAEQKELWISCVFPGEGNKLPDGSTVRDVTNALLGKREGARSPDGVGINCLKVGKVEGLITEFENAVKELVERGEVQEWPSLVVYPDGTKGEVYNTTTKEWEVQASVLSTISWDESVFKVVRRAQDRGLWKSIFVGGCCKTAPDDIGKLRKRIDGK